MLILVLSLSVGFIFRTDGWQWPYVDCIAGRPAVLWSLNQIQDPLLCSLGTVLLILNGDILINLFDGQKYATQENAKGEIWNIWKVKTLKI